MSPKQFTRITRQYLANALHCNQTGEEISPELEERAKASNLVAFFGRTCFDLCVRGAISEDLPGENPIYISLNKRILSAPIETMLLLKSGLGYRKVEAIWKPKPLGADWLIHTELPHTKFDLFDDDAFFCRGIVINLNEITEPEFIKSRNNDN